MQVELRHSELADVYEIAGRLRDDDRLEITGLGLDPRQALRASYRNAVMRRTAFVDGEIAAMWGLGGVLLSDIGVPWLMTTKAVERVPVSFVRIARAQLADMLSRRMALENVVAASYTKACAFLAVLGFTLEAPRPMGPHGALYRPFWIRRHHGN